MTITNAALRRRHKGIRNFFCVICVVAMSPLTAPASEYDYDSVAGDMMNTRIYTLGNGLKVYLSVNDEKPRVHTYIAVRTGSRNDPAETTGLAHYLEHLMFKGTTRFGTSDAEREAPLLDSIEARFEQYRTITDPAARQAFYQEIDSLSQLAAQFNIPNEYDKLMAAIGSEGSNAFTTDDVTCYTEDIPSNEIENWAKIQGERFMNMVIRGFHTELEAVYEEYNMSLSEDMYKAWKALSAKLFPNHPYGTQTTIGTQEHLKNPSIANIKDYFNRYYVPNNVAICMSGDFDPDETIAIIDRYFGSWKPNAGLSFPQYEPVEELSAPADTVVVGNEGEYVMIGWMLDGAASQQSDTVEVVSYMLSNGTAGMFDLDINNNMLCAGATAFHQFMSEYSTFVLYGRPLEGQTLGDVRDIMLAEIDRLRSGDFDDGLLQAVINNLKLDYRRSLDNNEARAGMFVDAFVDGISWDRAVNKFERMSKLTKEDIAGFARRHFDANYAIVYKLNGDDTTLVKIDKPHITPIPANRDMQSDFVRQIIESKPEPIQPRFIDFDNDITTTLTAANLPVRYVRDDSNGLFTLAFYYNNIGEENDKWLPYAADFIDYIGTPTMSAVQRKQALYSLACDMSVSVGADVTVITLSGLAENMVPALDIVEDYIANAQADAEAYASYVGVVMKDRADSKLSQDANYFALCQYGMYGDYNTVRNVPDSAELYSKDPQELADMIGRLNAYRHEVLYCGPASIDELTAVINARHKTPETLLAAPAGRQYTLRPTPADDIILAPYPAKNIYLRQYNNEGRQWDASRQAVVELFNEYYGGGMNSVVFQELRESRALAYNAWAAFITPSRQGRPDYSITHIISQNDKMMDCIGTFNSIIDSIPQSDYAFGLAKQALTKRIATQRTTKFAIINAYLSARHLGIGYDMNEKVYNALPGLTLDDVVTFERETMAAKPRLYMILGDESDLDIDALETIAPVRRVSTETIFGY